MENIIFILFKFIYSVMHDYVLQNIRLTQQIVLSEEIGIIDVKDQISFTSIIDSIVGSIISTTESVVLELYQDHFSLFSSFSISPIWILRKIYVANAWTKIILVQVMLGNTYFVQKPQMVFGHNKYQEVSATLLGYAIEAMFITHGSYYPPFRAFGMGEAVRYACTVMQVWLYCFATAMIERPNPWQ